MNEQKRLLIRSISILLGYPDAKLAGSLDSIEKILKNHAFLQAGDSLKDVVAGMRELPILQLQEEYTRLFDFSPYTSFNLTYHKWGDAKERGHALARMHNLYRKAGFSLSGGELPDYLPLVLEFLSVCPDEAFSLVVREYRDEIETLASRLKDAGSIYARCLLTLLDVLYEWTPAAVENQIVTTSP